MKKTAHKIQIGHRYGDWTIIGEAQRLGSDLRYLCACVCGNEKMVSAITLRNGSSTNCGCQRRERAPRISDYELHPISTEIQEIFKLISEGCLPPADQFSMTDGAPSWTLPAMARILGIDARELINHLRAAGPRFNLPRAHSVSEDSATQA